MVVALLGDAGADGVRVLGRRHPDGRGASLIVDLPAPLRRRRRRAPARPHRARARRRDGRLPRGPRRGRPRAGALHRPLAGRAAGELDLPELEREISDAHAHLGRPRARGARRARAASAAACSPPAGRKRLPASYKAAVDPACGRGGHRLLRAPVHAAASRSSSGCATRATSRASACTARRQGRALARDADAREPRPARRSRSARRAWTATRGDVAAGLRRARARPTAPLDLDEAGERIADAIAAVLARRRGVGLAQPARDHRRPRLAADRDPARVPQVPPAAGARFTEGYQYDVIAANPHIAEKQLRLFELRFDPAASATPRRGGAARGDPRGPRRGRVARPRPHPAQPARAHRRDACARTPTARGRGALAFKVRSAEVPAMPQPAPLFEIFVYSPDIEGIHLRGGKIARGGHPLVGPHGLPHRGLRPHARADDQERRDRPDGAKGGFYLKARPEDAAELRAEVERQYARTSAALLDITDNLVDGEVVHPEGVRVLDDDDTYLVVAADKGTATFSDTANAIAQRATASGSATRSRRAARTATTTRSSASPRAARGSRSSATSASSAWTPRSTRSRPSASAT